MFRILFQLIKAMYEPSNFDSDMPIQITHDNFKEFHNPDIKFGEIWLAPYKRNIKFICEFCGEKYKIYQKFLKHSLGHLFLSEDEVQQIINNVLKDNIEEESRIDAVQQFHSRISKGKVSTVQKINEGKCLKNPIFSTPPKEFEEDVQFLRSFPHTNEVGCSVQYRNFYGKSQITPKDITMDLGKEESLNNMKLCCAEQKLVKKEIELADDMSNNIIVMDFDCVEELDIQIDTDNRDEDRPNINQEIFTTGSLLSNENINNGVSDKNIYKNSNIKLNSSTRAYRAKNTNKRFQNELLLDVANEENFHDDIEECPSGSFENVKLQRQEHCDNIKILESEIQKYLYTSKNQNPSTDIALLNENHLNNDEDQQIKFHLRNTRSSSQESQVGREFILEEDELHNSRLRDSSSHSEIEVDLGTFSDIEYIDYEELQDVRGFKGFPENDLNTENYEVDTQEHASVQIEISKYTCDQCLKTFSRASYLKAHKKTHLQENLVCNHCGQRCRNNASYERHIKRHVEIQVHNCDICNKSYVVLAELKRHMKRHTNERNYKCDECGGTFFELAGLKVHQKIHVFEKLKESSTAKNVGRRDFEIKNKSSSERNSFKKSENRIETEIVNVSYIEKFNKGTAYQKLNRKAKVVIKDPQPLYEKSNDINDSSKNLEYECDICLKRFEFSQHLSLHKKRHLVNEYNNQKEIIAPISPAAKRRKYKTPREYKCDICEKQFSKQYSLTLHKRRHDNIKNFTCEICGAAFFDGTNFTTHVRRHMGLKTHKCPICEKMFVTTTEVKLHLRVHTGERPYQCEICKATFTANNSLHSHRRNVHNMK